MGVPKGGGSTTSEKCWKLRKIIGYVWLTVNMWISLPLVRTASWEWARSHFYHLSSVDLTWSLMSRYPLPHSFRIQRRLRDRTLGSLNWFRIRTPRLVKSHDRENEMNKKMSRRCVLYTESDYVGHRWADAGSRYVPNVMLTQIYSMMWAVPFFFWALSTRAHHE